MKMTLAILKYQRVWKKRVTFPDLKHQIRIASMYFTAKNKISVFQCAEEIQILNPSV